MLLAVDIGNTHVVIAAMRGSSVHYKARLAADKLKTEYEYAVSIKELLRLGGIEPGDIEGCCLSSVSPVLTESVSGAVRLITGKVPMTVGAGLKTGLNIRIDNPSECGADLVTAAVGALKSFKPPMIIIDMGTATTLSAIDKNGAFVGGAIAPGLITSVEALSEKTALLPSVGLNTPASAIGKNTADCMRSGAILGAAGMIDGLVERMCAELEGSVTLVATGGIAKIVIPNCSHKITVSEDLVFEGLAAIYERNRRI